MSAWIEGVPGKPVPHVGAHLGGVWQAKANSAKRRVLITIALPLIEWGPVMDTIGPPPLAENRAADWQTGHLPPVLFAPARYPRHPETVADVLAEAWVDALARGLADRSIRVTPSLSVKLDALRQAIVFAPTVFPGSEGR